MDRQEEQIAHELKIIMPANLRKTAPQRRFMPKLPIRHPHLAQAATIEDRERFPCPTTRYGWIGPSADPIRKSTFQSPTIEQLLVQIWMPITPDEVSHDVLLALVPRGIRCRHGGSTARSFH
jgi:hypothetical protein